MRIFDAESIRGNPSEKKTEIKNEGIENDNESKTLQTLEENEMYSIDKANRAQNSIIIFEQVRSKSFFFKNHTVGMLENVTLLMISFVSQEKLINFFKYFYFIVAREKSHGSYFLNDILIIVCVLFC